MKILFRILALFLIMPVIELALLVKVAELIDFWPTIAIILATGLIGSFLAKREGLSVWQRLQQRLDTGGLPGKELLDGVIILIAGALLITPGVLTDVIGFLGLIPFTRSIIRKLVMKRIRRAMENGQIQATFGSFGTASWESSSYEGGYTEYEVDYETGERSSNGANPGPAGDPWRAPDRDPSESSRNRLDEPDSSN